MKNKIVALISAIGFTAMAQSFQPAAESAVIRLNSPAPLTASPSLRAVSVDTNGTIIVADPASTPASAVGRAWNFFSNSGIAQATNWLIAPYGTYAPSAPQKYGGGLFAVYNVNNYVGLGVGADWLGSFSLVSANVSLKADTHPLRGFFGTGTNSFFYDFTATPFALAGQGYDLHGSGTHTIWDLGLQTRFGHFMGGRFGVGGAYGAWVGDSAYDVKRYHFFLDWQKGF